MALANKVEKSLRDPETTILHILGTEILGLFQNDLLSNYLVRVPFITGIAVKSIHLKIELLFWRY